MLIPLQITFRNMEPSAAIEGQVKKRVRRLERYCDYISRCDVRIEAPHRHHHKGNLYQVSIDITIPPGHEFLVNEEKRRSHAHEDVYVALRDAFKAARRQLQDHVRKARRQVKRHEPATGEGNLPPDNRP